MTHTDAELLQSINNKLAAEAKAIEDQSDARALKIAEQVAANRKLLADKVKADAAREAAIDAAIHASNNAVIAIRSHRGVTYSAHNGMMPNIRVVYSEVDGIDVGSEWQEYRLKMAINDALLVA